MSHYPSGPIKLSRDLRKRLTPAERILWKLLRNRKFLNYKFLRQHVIYYGVGIRGEPKFFITDFYCAQFKLIIELDGAIHDFTQEYDNYRSNILIDMGYSILRIRNDEVKEIEAVLKQIREKINELGGI